MPSTRQQTLLVGVLAIGLLAGCYGPTGGPSVVVKPATPPEYVQVITLEHECFDRFDGEQRQLATQLAEVRNTSGPSVEPGAGDFNILFDTCPTAGPDTLYIRADGFTVRATLTWNVTVTDAGPS